MKKFSSKTKVDKRDGKLVRQHGLGGIHSIGGTAGLSDARPPGQFELPFGIGYYQLLTLHGVVLALVMTFFFIMGFQIAALSRTCWCVLVIQSVVWAGLDLR